jgi:hypothetical protein
MAQDASSIAEQEARFCQSHPEDMAELETFLFYLEDNFERAYKRMRAGRTYCSISTLPELHHYLIFPTRPDQVLARVVRFVPGTDLEPVRLDIVFQPPSNAYSESDARPANVVTLHELRRGRQETTQRSDVRHGTQTHTTYKDNPRQAPHDRHKWLSPFGY